MAPSEKNEFQRFRDLIFEAMLPADGSGSWLGSAGLQGSIGLLRPRASSLWESIVEWFVCPEGKLIGQVTPYDMSMYLQTRMGLKWVWIQEWICLYIE
jgi:hypothetical protein